VSAPNKNNPVCLKCWVIPFLLIEINPKTAIAMLAKNLKPMAKNGFQKWSGAKQFRCGCGFTITEGDRPAHRPTIGDRAMSQSERDKRYRKRLKISKSS
jgi:hypothetical protein